MTQLIEASTLYQVASLSAMVDHGAIPDDGERVLVLVNSARQPELTGRLQDAAGFQALVDGRFDRIVDLGADLWPRRPHQFDPREDELPLWQRLFRNRWSLGEGAVTLWLESLQANPAKALARIFASSPLAIHSDGLMSYGPTRVTLPPSILQRVERLSSLDLVPGLQPLLLAEVSPTVTSTPLSAFRRIVDIWANEVEPSGVTSALSASSDTVALLLGQYLTDLRLVSAEEDAELAEQMVTACVEAGATRIAFKPHPSASVASRQAVLEAGRRQGIEVVVIPDTVAAEVVALWLHPIVAVSAFSTALVTLAYGLGIRPVAVGTEKMLARLAPFENSNRIPLTLIDALFEVGIDPPVFEPDSSLLQELTEAVGYAMRSRLLPDLRDDTESFLIREPELRDRYIKQRRLRVLGLPSAPRNASGLGGVSPRYAARRLLERQLGTAGAQRAITQMHRARRSPRQAVEKIGNALVAWSKAR